MPWKIVNLDFASDHPHLHVKDPNQPIHMRSYFSEKRVEIGLGADDPDECFVRATVTPDAVVVDAVQFQPLHVNILSSILASLDVEPHERDAALAWMHANMKNPRAGEFIHGNVASFPAPTGWPYDLTDEALLDSLDDRGALPSTRVHALRREAERRGLRRPERRGAPEVIRRR
jgi:hypothetical protein